MTFVKFYVISVISGVYGNSEESIWPILIDQNRSEILAESMRYSFLVKFEGFNLQLYYQPYSFTGIVLIFFVLLF